MSKSKDLWAGALVAAGCASIGYLFLRETPTSKQRREDARLYAAANHLLAAIANVMGCVKPPLLLSRSTSNAHSDGENIVVNPDWVKSWMNALCTNTACNRELVIGLLAHELAHHVHGDVFAPPWDKLAIELRADRFAGTALARLGVSAQAFASGIWAISSHFANDRSDYPDRRSRFAAICDGYASEQRRLLVKYYQAGQLAALRTYGLAA